MRTKPLLLILLLLASCGGKTEDDHKVSPIERKVFNSIDLASRGQSTSPLIITQRKLSVAEIGKHLDMDDETVFKHLKATNVHGYFSLSVKNLPPQGNFTLYHVTFDGRMLPDKSFFVNGNGILVTKLDDQFIDIENNFLFFSNYLPGEPINFALVSDDQKLVATSKIIPNPIEKVDNDNHRVSLEIASANKKSFIVHCSGLQPFGVYMLATSFENERFAYPFEANDRGEAFIRTGPNAPWITTGEGTLNLRGDGISKPLHLEFIWGG